MPDVTGSISVPLQHYIERRIDDHCQLNDTRFEALEAKLRKADEILTIRLDALNQSRELLRDQTMRYVTNETHAAMLTAWDDRICRDEERLNMIERRLSNLDGRLAAYAAALFVVLTLISIGVRFIP